MSGIDLMANERRRHLEVKGWTPEHDDQYKNGELLHAAHCYAEFARTIAPLNERQRRIEAESATVPARWPWAKGYWRPSPNPIRNLAKSGALMAADMDRLDRAQKRADCTNR